MLFFLFFFLGGGGGNSIFEKEKQNLFELDCIKTRGARAILKKTFASAFSAAIEAGALGVERIYKAGAERVNEQLTEVEMYW